MDKESLPQETKSPAFAPSHYMRSRRPHMFSDSESSSEGSVTREVLSYHLETLTNLKDETKFEVLAHRLCEKFISPNLRPQTGPSGGGDGKTDAETYPVSEAVAIRWFVPDADGAKERWAFAFSAKRAWRPKVQSDVKSIAGTKRGYPRIYFVTNQFVPSRSSAEVQDALEKKYGIPIIILDRSWILDRIFEGDSLDIAIDVLGVGGGSERDTKKLGPNDYERTAELEAFERDISDGSKYTDNPSALADDTRNAALLARGLEKPRDEVEGKFLRAVRIAKDNNLEKKELAATYDWAWTSYFWFDDPTALTTVYDDVERLAINSDGADDLERLNNLLPLLRMAVHTGLLPVANAKLDNRTADLTTALTRVSSDTSRPNNALHAHALLLLTHMSERVGADPHDPLIDIWEEFIVVVDEADGLGTFPFKSIANAITAVGEFVTESEAFDCLYEKITDGLAARRSEGEAAKKNTERAFQKLAKGLPYEAIRWFGRAVTLLIKDEYDAELVQALVGSSFAYEEVGLLWAARNYILAAASQELSLFQKSGQIEYLSPSIFGRYFWLELRLGRMPQILVAHQLHSAIGAARARTAEQHKECTKALTDHALMLGALVLRTPFGTLPRVAQLPDSFDRIGLPQCRLALLFLLGHDDTIQEEGWVSAELTPEDYASYFEDWHADGNEMELLECPDYALDEEVTLQSQILGCRLEVTCKNNLTSLAIGEAVLGALEALLATSLTLHVLPHLDRLRLRIVPVDGMPLTPKLSFADVDGHPVGTITHASLLIHETRDDVHAFPIWLKSAVLEIFLKFAIPSDLDTWSAAVFDKENALDRALTFSNVPTMVSNLFGDGNQIGIADWMEDEDTRYVLKRVEAWKPKPIDEEKNSGKVSAPSFGDGEPPKGMFDTEKMKHTDMEIVSPIDVHKWNAARWGATLFMYEPNRNDVTPVLGLAFAERKPAAAIFEGLRSRLGQNDPNNELRIAIIRGISAADPNAYSIIIGPNLDNIAKTSGNIIGFVSRINQMRPTSLRNLETFLDEFRKHKRYLLVPAHFPSRTSQPDLMFELGLGKCDLTIREAWQISDNDPDVSVLDLDDPPLIPNDQPNAPAIKAMEHLATLRKKLK